MTSTLNDQLVKYKSILHNLDADELDMLIQHTKILAFNKGDVFIQQGSQHDELYIIIEGTVTVSAKILGHGIAKIETLGPGNFLNEVSFIMKAPSATSIVAGESLQCITITRAYFDFLDIYSPITKYKIIATLSKQICCRIRDIHTKLVKVIASLDMTTRSFVVEVIKSLNKPTMLTFEDVHESSNELKQSTLFKDFTDKEIELIMKSSEVISAKKNCLLIQENEIDRTCYIVLRGAVQSSIIQDSKVAKLSVIGPMILFCSISIIDHAALSTINFTTCENSILLKLTPEFLEQLRTTNTELWHKFYQLIGKSIISLERSMDKLDIRLNIETYNR